MHVNALTCAFERIIQYWDIPGLSAYIVARGEAYIVHSQGSRPTTRPLQDDTIWPLGSISKHFTASALLAMEKRLPGLWEMRVNEIRVPGLVLNDPSIRIRDLALHVSGLSNKTAMEFGSALKENALRHELSNIPQTNARNHHAHYTNAGFCVLGQILDHQGGGFDEAWTAGVHESLRGYDFYPRLRSVTKACLDRLVEVFDPATRGGAKLPPLELQSSLGASSAFASFRAMQRLLDELLVGEIGQGSYPLNIQQTRTEDGEELYSLGWRIAKPGPVSYHWHSGRTAGCHSAIAWSRETKAGYFVAVNADEYHAHQAAVLTIRKFIEEGEVADFTPYYRDREATRRRAAAARIHRLETEGSWIEPLGYFHSPTHGGLSITARPQQSRIYDARFDHWSFFDGILIRLGPNSFFYVRGAGRLPGAGYEVRDLHVARVTDEDEPCLELLGASFVQRDLKLAFAEPISQTQGV